MNGAHALSEARDVMSSAASTGVERPVMSSAAPVVTVSGSDRAADSACNITDDDGGGWPSAEVSGTDGRRCDLDVIEVTTETWPQALAERVRSSRPALFRFCGDARIRAIRADLRRASFTHGGPYARRFVRLSRLPYVDDRASSTTMSSSWARALLSDRRPRGEPLYVFVDNFWKTGDVAVAAAEALLEGVAAHDGTAGMVTLREFFMGGNGTGSQWHWHRMVLNVAAYGRKQWWVLPPDRARYSREPTTTLEGDEMHCLQQPGEIVFLPDRWAHSTRNDGISVGVAIEVGFPGWDGKAPRLPACAECVFGDE